MQNEGVKTQEGETVGLILISNSSKHRNHLIFRGKKVTPWQVIKMLIERGKKKTKPKLKGQENSNTARSRILPFQRAIYWHPVSQHRLIRCPVVGCEHVNGQANNGYFQPIAMHINNKWGGCVLTNCMSALALEHLKLVNDVRIKVTSVSPPQSSVFASLQSSCTWTTLFCTLPEYLTVTVEVLQLLLFRT